MRNLITSALPYANGPLHLGHMAGAYLPADIYARYLRLMGRKTLWVCGSDEHGAAITMRAKKEGISPRDIVDKYHKLNKETFETLGISFDYYHRTSAKLHHETSQEFFLELLKKGDQFSVKSQEQYYDEEYDQFLADRYIKGTCPKCSYEEAFGDQCERCGSDLSPTELIDPVSTLSGNKPILRETKHWYFRLQEHETWLREWIENGTVDGQKLHDPNEWKKHVVGQCLSWLNDGLRERSITRDLDWGISVPVEGAEGKVLYVWFDAPIGYISSTRKWCQENGGDWRSWWQGDQSRLVHFIGKDNIVFHCLIFPAMLRAHGDYILPENVPANQFLNFEGDKFSKSRGWGIQLHEYVEDFSSWDNYRAALRWALIRNMPEQQDADFTWEGFIEYHDKDLADKLGNFINRVTVLMHKYFQGRVPESGGKYTLPEGIERLVVKIGTDIESYRFKDAATTFVELASLGNTYMQEAAPWSLAKENPDDPRIAEVMYVCAQIAAILAITATPFIPFAAVNLRKALGQHAVQNGDWATMIENLEKGVSILPEGQLLGQAGVLFPKIHDRKDNSRLALITAQLDKLEAIRAEDAANSREEIKPEISFEDFTRLDLRTATILKAEKVKKADKLLHLTLDLGSETRSVLSGIAEHYQASDIIGKQVVLVANLAPRKMRGIMSEGMVLMAEDNQGKLVFVAPPQGFGNGWVVK